MMLRGGFKTYEAIVKGENVPEPGVPESFKVLIKELQSLCLDIKVLAKNKEEVVIKGIGDDDDDDVNETAKKYGLDIQQETPSESKDTEMIMIEDVAVEDSVSKPPVEEEQDALNNSFIEDGIDSDVKRI